MPDKKQARKVLNWYARVGGMPGLVCTILNQYYNDNL